MDTIFMAPSARLSFGIVDLA